jgi:D-xylono/L-arabinono-1,4-lactonase
VNDQEPCEVEVIADYACELGENPLWHPMEHCLYWCDILKGRLYRYSPASDIHEQCFEGRTIGGFTIQADGALLLFMDGGTISMWREGWPLQIVAQIEAERTSRFNDVIADPLGRVLCGAMPTSERKGRLYRIDLDGSIHVLLENIGCPNGMAFTLDNRGVYFTDSDEREIYFFDYNVEDGSLTNRRVIARFDDADGLPDGATLDAQGRLWSALWLGSGIVRLRNDGSIAERISIPALKTTSLTFGGQNYSDIYVTSAGGDAKEPNGNLAGALFRLRSKIQGRAEFLSRIKPGEFVASAGPS